MMESLNLTGKCSPWMSGIMDSGRWVTRLTQPVSRIFLLILDIPFFCFGKKLSAKDKQLITEHILPGDIVLYADRHFPVWQLIVRAGGNSYYGHAGIYEGNGQVIEATTVYPCGSRVTRTGIGAFLNGYKSVCVLRPFYHSETLRDRTLDFAVAQLGKPYDFKLNFSDNDTVYCTELVAKAIGESGIATPVTCFCGRKFYMPDDFLKIENTSIIYENTGKSGNSSSLLVAFIVSPTIFSISLLANILTLSTCSICCVVMLLLSILAGWAQYTIFLSSKINN